MTILVDDPIWAAHGRRWAHLVSDQSLEELHAFELGATKVGAKELLGRLIAAGLRVRRTPNVELNIERVKSFV